MLGTVLRVALLAAATLLGSCNRAPESEAAANPRDISGVWWGDRYSPKMEPAGGGAIALTDSGQMRYAANAALLAADPLSDESRKFCLPDGVPRILGNPYPFQILQDGDIVTIVYELNRVVRVIKMDVTLPPDEDLELYPWYSGHSVGRWDGDTLVIETAGYNDKTFIDAAGMPHSNKMRTVERVRKVDGTLEIEVTVTDPVTFTAPWSARFTYAPHKDVRLMDHVCGEPHRDISHIAGVTVPPGAVFAPSPAAPAPSQAPGPDVPDFSGLWDSGGKEPPLTGRPGVRMHPEHIERGTRAEDRSRQDPIPPIGDATDPILKPWAAAIVKDVADRRIGGEIVPQARSQCLPSAIPVLVYEGGPRLVVQAPTQLTVIHEELPEVRHIYLDVPQSENVQPGWYGESVGRFEGDTLVVTTIGITGKTWVDDFLTPHTDAMRVTERFRLRDPNTIEVSFTVEDEGTFNEPWGGLAVWERAGADRELVEIRCSENNFDPNTGGTLPMPVATRLDF